MKPATLRRIHIHSTGRPIGDRMPATEMWSELLFEGDVGEALGMARAIPADERLMLDLETDFGTFKPDEFDALAEGRLHGTGIDLPYRDLTIRVTFDAITQLCGDVGHPISRSRVMADHFDQLDAIMKRKLAAGAFVDGLLTIDAEDLA